MAGPQLQFPGEDHSPALALVNSLHASPAGTVDHLADTGALDDWLLDRGLLTEHASPDHDAVAGFHALRTATRALLLARIEHRSPPGAAVRTINTAASTTPGTPILVWADGTPPAHAWNATPGSTPLDRALSAIGADAIELLCGERGDRLIACDGPRCVRIVLKDHPRRKWCSSTCGQRIRAARYYQRHTDTRIVR